MENKIDKIITLDNGIKYMIIDQGNCNQKAYFLVSKLDENDHLTNHFSIVEENIENNKQVFMSVKDQELLKMLADYFSKRNA